MTVQARELIGLDIGQKRTGIARASSVARLAEPLITVDTEQLIPKLEHIIRKYQPELIVVGLPRNLQSNETEQTKWVRGIIGDIQSHFVDVRFEFQDEALTTVAATEQLAKNTADIDSLAASIILQDFLDEEARKGAKNE